MIIPKHSRNVYDAALRARRRARDRGDDAGGAGGRARPAHRAHLHPGRPGRGRERRFPRRPSRPIAKPRGVPVLVDAAAEILTVPNVHLQNGATLVGLQRRQVPARAADRRPPARTQGPREGGLGPQRAASRLLARLQGRQGRSDRHAHGRRDVDEARPRRGMEDVDLVARVRRPSASRPSTASRPRSSSRKGLSNRMPSLRVFWDRKQVRHWRATPWCGRSSTATRAWASSPPATRRIPPSTGVSVNPYMMAAGRREDRGRPALRAAVEPAAQGRGAAARGRGRRPQRAVGRARRIRGGHARTTASACASAATTIDGAHRGDFVSRDLTGTIDGDSVRIRSFLGEQNGDSLAYTFTGKVTGDEMARHARHGRVPGRHVDGATPRRAEGLSR